MSLPDRRIVSPSAGADIWRIRPPAPPVTPQLEVVEPPVEAAANLAATTLVLAVADPDRRWILRRSLERTGSLEVLAEVGDSRACLEAVREHAPYAVVIELDLVGGDELYVARLADATVPRPAVVALDGLTDPQRFERVLRSGAVGVVRRDAPPRDLAAQVAALIGSAREERPEPA